MVHSGASVESGVIHSYYKMPIAESKKLGIEKEGGLNAKDILEFYKELRAKHPGKIAIYADNGRYQNSPEIRKWSEENGVPVMNNLKYRPECNGIEEIWGWAKRKYRAIVGYHKAMELDWNQIEMVKAIMESVPKGVASAYITRGWDALRTAKAIVPEDLTTPKPRGWDPTKFAPHLHELHKAKLYKAASDEEGSDSSSDSEFDFIAGHEKVLPHIARALTKRKTKSPAKS